MFSLLFHKDVFFPDKTQYECNCLQKHFTSFNFSKHLEEHCANQLVEDKSHKYLKDVLVECLNTLKETPRDVFEVELSKDYHFFKMSGWFVTKYCVRIPYNSKQDIVVSIRPKYKNEDGKSLKIVDNLIVTAWMNHCDDNHYTLDESKYCSKEQWEQANKK